MKNKYWQKTKADRNFKIMDIDCVIVVEFMTRKYLLGMIDDYIENINYGYYDEDIAYTILYKDGTTDIINYEYDGHKIKKN